MNDYLKTQLTDLDQKIAQAKELLSEPEMADLAETEIALLEQQKQELIDSSVTPMTSNTENLDNNSEDEVNPNTAILEIRAAAGGDEAGLFAADLLRMYLRFAENQHWKSEQLDVSEGGLGQIKHVVIQIKGKQVYPTLKYESGVHRVQRVPETESGGRVHTSTATVAVLPEISAKEVYISPADIEFAAFRSGGAGGQNVNKVNTAVRVKHIPSGLVVTAQTERSQLQNRENAMNLLRAKLWEIEQQKQSQTIGFTRSAQIGSGDRSEKIRTYNFSQNRITDHRINKSWHNLENILDGNLLPVIQALQTYEQPT